MKLEDIGTASVRHALASIPVTTKARNRLTSKSVRPVETAATQSLDGLRYLWLEITPSCNLRCRHCYTESSPLLKDPKLVDWKAILADARGIGCRQVQFIGGEPVANPRLMEYVATAHQLGYESIEIYTNVTLVSDALCDRLRKYGVHVATSFYSPRRETHDLITGVGGSFDRTVRGIRKLLAAGVPLRIGMIAMEANENDIDGARKFLVDLGVDDNKIGTDHARPVGRELASAKRESLEKTLCGHCWKGKLAVSWDGMCYPCVFARAVPIGNVMQCDLKSIVDSKRLRQFRKRIFDSSAAQAGKAQAEAFLSRFVEILSTR